MELIPHWNDAPALSGAISRSGVLLFSDPAAALIRTGIPIWPPPEVVQKFSKSDAASAFSEELRGAVTSSLGRYTALQSVNSEDAMTWAVFGPIVYAAPSTRERFVAALLHRLELPNGDVSGATVWLWRRIPHPDTWVSGGPEIDVGIQTRDAVILGEAKWRSLEARNQGENGKATQFGLRHKFCADSGARSVYAAGTTFVVLGISLSGGLATSALPTPDAGVLVRDLTWDQLCGMEEHPIREELGLYLAWKRARSGLLNE